MASGFIILKDGRCFARRWTGYDEIIRIAITELEQIENGKDLAEWLMLQIPNSEDDESADAGWGFHNSRIDEWINRELDLRSLTKENQKLFWRAIQKGKNKLTEQGVGYSPLSFDFFYVFYDMCERAEKGEPPLALTDWNKLADPCTEQNGPGWKK
ncbi:hypothetical protein [Aureibacter tunicatorum]|uniref:Uncharacterized protein n=1 Tax=Aureibacter tunicatorum TaxID=866807 RepID=A0AAE3XNJ8_9BACT|nr:hypothetical protein [Aureibacter tunicatorum]MDR6241206.1 hypothetical protein [Aureibacter tunicatorum]BDD03981.1 hypothetical protein AUTU_14640 [Aureibacter tunicatorum]